MSIRKEMGDKERMRIAESANIRMMADEFGLSATTIKLALVGPRQRTNDSIPLFNDIPSVARAFKKAKSFVRSRDIARQWISLCTNFEELEDCEQSISNFDFLHLSGYYAEALDSILSMEVEHSNDFRSAQAVWIKCEGTRLESLAYRKMLSLSTGKSLWDVFAAAYDTTWGISVENHYYTALMHACADATPEQAVNALKRMHEFSWNDEENSYLVRLLIAKAAELYRK